MCDILHSLKAYAVFSLNGHSLACTIKLYEVVFYGDNCSVKSSIKLGFNFTVIKLLHWQKNLRRHEDVGFELMTRGFLSDCTTTMPLPLPVRIVEFKLLKF